MEGLSFHYMVKEEQSNKSSDVLDIVVTKGDLYLGKVPFETVSDFEISQVPLSSITIKRCSVKFGELTNDQKSRLEDFIQNHTTWMVH